MAYNNVTMDYECWCKTIYSIVSKTDQAILKPTAFQNEYAEWLEDDSKYEYERGFDISSPIEYLILSI